MQTYIKYSLNYHHKKNPILCCLADQMNITSSEKWNSSDVLNSIFGMLESDEKAFEGQFQLISKEKWMEKMRASEAFYYHHPEKEMKWQEELLFSLSAKALKRQIIAIPFLENGSKMSFGIERSCQKSLFLMHCTSIRYKNFFISIIPL